MPLYGCRLLFISLREGLPLVEGLSANQSLLSFAINNEWNLARDSVSCAAVSEEAAKHER